MWLSSHLGQCMMAATTWEAFVIAVNELIFRLLRGWGYNSPAAWGGRRSGLEGFRSRTAKRSFVSHAKQKEGDSEVPGEMERKRAVLNQATPQAAKRHCHHHDGSELPHTPVLGKGPAALLSSRQILLTIQLCLQKQVKQLDLSLLLLFRQQHRRQNRRLWPNQRPKWKQKQRLQHQNLNQRQRLQWCQLCRSMVAKHVTSKMAAKNVAIAGLATRSHGVGKLAPETLCDLVGKSGCGVLRCVRSDAFRSGCFHMLNGLGERPWSMMWGVCVGGKSRP